MSLLVFVLGISFYAGKVQAATVPSVSVYRLYNPNTGEHFYTSSKVEQTQLLHIGWQDEGIGWSAPTTGANVYRLYNPNVKGGDHYYTESLTEKNMLIKAGWHYDGIFWHSGGTVPVYVAYNPNAISGAHNFTTNLAEQNGLLKVGWKYGTTAWYATALGKGVPSNDCPEQSF